MSIMKYINFLTSQELKKQNRSYFKTDQSGSALHHRYSDTVDSHIQLLKVRYTSDSSLFIFSLHREPGACKTITSDRYYFAVQVLKIFFDFMVFLINCTKLIDINGHKFVHMQCVST